MGKKKVPAAKKKSVKAKPKLKLKARKKKDIIGELEGVLGLTQGTLG
jgi:hypothetical protein